MALLLDDLKDDAPPPGWWDRPMSPVAAAVFAAASTGFWLAVITVLVRWFT